MAEQKDVKPVVLEDVRIVFRNFSGAASRFNAAGQRNFCVILEDDVAAAMKKDGWNVKYLSPREEDEEPTPYIQVKVSYANRPPRVVLVTDRGQTHLGEGEVSIMDWADIRKVDVIFRPYPYDVNGRQGLSAYCQSLYVTINEDELERKYADTPVSAAEAIATRDEPPFRED